MNPLNVLILLTCYWQSPYRAVSSSVDSSDHDAGQSH